MAATIINRYIELFSTALNEIGTTPSMEEIEHLAVLIHRSMEQPRRVYHNSAHVFALSEGMNASQVLAALFHDLVYVQLDQGFAHWTRKWLDPLVNCTDGEYRLKSLPDDDTELQMCAKIFAFRAGQRLSPYAGLNEFLSAVVAVRTLSPYLEAQALLPIVLCIEATVPFRGEDNEGNALPAQLLIRLQHACDSLGIPLSAAVMEKSVTDALELTNRDVAGFAVADQNHFLCDTWTLIEESNAPLASVGVYTLSEYRQALQRMDVFLATLDHRNIFHPQHRDDTTLAAKRAAAKQNLDFAVRYLNAKLLGIAIVEALAKLTGGDAPISMLLGDICSATATRIEKFLVAEPETTPPLDRLMQDILANGRHKASHGDTAASPMTAYLHRWLGDAGMDSGIQQAQLMFQDKLSPMEFLKSLPTAPVAAITRGCAAISLSRGTALNAIAAELYA